MRIVFMGSPDFAVRSLEQLLESEHQVIGIVTNPDRASGRGRSPKPTPVKEKALAHEKPVLQPANLEDPAFIDRLRYWDPDIQVVVAFRILPEKVFSIPKWGSINLHASLLPHYRGAAPIQRALMNGEQKTGVTTFRIDEGMDRGNILMQAEVEVRQDMTAGELHDLLADRGAKLLEESLNALEKGELEPLPQPSAPERAPSAPKLGKADRFLDWSSSASALHDHIRAMSPIPAVRSKLERADREDLELKILRASVEDRDAPADPAPGTIREVREDGLIVGVGSGRLRILKLQPTGKKAMEVEAFLRGYGVREGDRFR